MWSPGVGRYLNGMAPQVAVAAVPAVAGGVCTNGATGGCDVHLSMVHSGDVMVGAETLLGKSQFGFYYGDVYAQRNTFQDLSAVGAVKPFIGFGNFGANAATAGIMNRAI